VIQIIVSPVLHRHLSIWFTIFNTFDYFAHGDSTLILEDIPLDIFLFLPLYEVLEGIGDEHWTKRYRKLEAGVFPVFDNNQQRLRLRCRGEYSRFPG
jgi:hypothetical protein